MFSANFLSKINNMSFPIDKINGANESAHKSSYSIAQIMHDDIKDRIEIETQKIFAAMYPEAVNNKHLLIDIIVDITKIGKESKSASTTMPDILRRLLQRLISEHAEIYRRFAKDSPPTDQEIIAIISNDELSTSPDYEPIDAMDLFNRRFDVMIECIIVKNLLRACVDNYIRNDFCELDIYLRYDLSIMVSIHKLLDMISSFAHRQYHKFGTILNYYLIYSRVLPPTNVINLTFGLFALHLAPRGDGLTSAILTINMFANCIAPYYNTNENLFQFIRAKTDTVNNIYFYTCAYTVDINMAQAIYTNIDNTFISRDCDIKK
jgi:hypothetical protein